MEPDSLSSEEVAGNADADTDSPDDELVVEHGDGDDRLVDKMDLEPPLLLLLLLFSLMRDLSRGVTSLILRQFSAFLIILTTSA